MNIQAMKNLTAGVSRETRTLDYLEMAQVMAEIARVCAKTSDSYELQLWASERDTFPEGYEDKVRQKQELIDLSKWFHKDAKDWVIKSKDLNE